MCNAHNHHPGCTCGWGGDGHLGGGGWHGGYLAAFSDRVATTSRSGGESSGAPRTYTTRCWWCGAEVYYHTNGYGDSVLFDSLGWPWEVHGCWEAYRRSLPRSPSSGGSSAGGHYHAPAETVPALTRATPPTCGHQHAVAVTGYIAKNHILWPLPSACRLHTGDMRHAARWFRLDIAIGKTSYPFDVPEDIAYRIKEQAIVQAAGQWLRWDGRWFLIATQLAVTAYPEGKQTIHKVIDLPESASCHRCGVSIAQCAWGIDTFRKVTCAACMSRLAGAAARNYSAPHRQQAQTPPEGKSQLGKRPKGREPIRGAAPAASAAGTAYRMGQLNYRQDIGHYVRDDETGTCYPCRTSGRKAARVLRDLIAQLRQGVFPRVRYRLERRHPEWIAVDPCPV
jgi:hypothetical protein